MGTALLLGLYGLTNIIERVVQASLELQASIKELQHTSEQSMGPTTTETSNLPSSSVTATEDSSGWDHYFVIMED